jgi:thymidine phosphorylase
LPTARALAQSLVQVAQGAGLPTRGFITDMNQVLGRSAGNALEVHEALALLQGHACEPRLVEVTRMLSAELLLIGGLSDRIDNALARVDAVLADGRALERFARMVAALGGPADFIERANAYLPAAPVQLAVRSARTGWVSRMATREIGLLVVELGGGRRRAGDAVDPRVGLSDIASVGQHIDAGELLATVHATDEASAAAAGKRLLELIDVSDAASPAAPVLIDRLMAPSS